METLDQWSGARPGLTLENFQSSRREIPRDFQLARQSKSFAFSVQLCNLQPLKRMNFCIRVWLILFLFPGNTLEVPAVEKIIRIPIQTEYGVRDPEFLRSINQHLQAEMTSGNKVTVLNNGEQFFPAM